MGKVKSAIVSGYCRGEGEELNPDYETEIKKFDTDEEAIDYLKTMIPEEDAFSIFHRELVNDGRLLKETIGYGTNVPTAYRYWRVVSACDREKYLSDKKATTSDDNPVQSLVDQFGQVVNVGDNVIFIVGHTLSKGTITKLNKKTVTVDNSFIKPMYMVAKIN